MATFTDQNFLEFVLGNLLDDPKAMELERTVDSFGTLLTLKVPENEMGKLIGKGGQTVKALRLLLRLIAAKKRERINLKILEPGTN